MHEVVREKGECVSAPLPSVSRAYSSEGASQVPPIPILLMHSAYASRKPEGQAQRPLGNVVRLKPFFFSLHFRVPFGLCRAYGSAGGLAAREVRRLGCRERGQEEYA